MPQGVGGVTDFARDFSAGAGIVQAAWARQERLIKLKADEARLQLAERQMVEEARQWDQQYALNQEKIRMAKDAEQENAAALLAARDFQIQKEAEGFTKDEAAMASLDMLMLKRPALALQVAKVQTEKAKQQHLVGQSGESFTPELMTVTNRETGEEATVLKTSKGGATLLHSKQKDGELNPADKIALENAHRGLNRVEKDLAELPEEGDEKEEAQKRVLLTQKLGYKRTIADITNRTKSKSASTPKTSPAAAPSKKIIVRDKNGNRFRLPIEQLEEAKRQGYEPEE